jgi:hypothetical protein
MYENHTLGHLWYFLTHHRTRIAVSVCLRMVDEFKHL